MIAGDAPSHELCQRSIQLSYRILQRSLLQNKPPRPRTHGLPQIIVIQKAGDGGGVSRHIIVPRQETGHTILDHFRNASRCLRNNRQTRCLCLKIGDAVGFAATGPDIGTTLTQQRGNVTGVPLSEPLNAITECGKQRLHVIAGRTVAGNHQGPGPFGNP